MKVARFSYEGEICFGVLDSTEDQRGIEIVELIGDPIAQGYETTGRRIPFERVRLLAPVIPRSKIVCVGKNYLDHIEEMREVTGAGRRGAEASSALPDDDGVTAPSQSEVPQEPLLFLKPNTSIIGPDEQIVRPGISQRVEHEGELAVVIGALAKEVPVEQALRVVFGFTCANDVTARDLQVQDGQWARAKGFDTFCPLGPVIETDLELADSRIETRVNGEVRQRSSTAHLIHSVAEIVAHASQAFTLLPGDVILTGTPAGVGPLEAGDTVEVDIEGIGVLRNTVR